MTFISRRTALAAAITTLAPVVSACQSEEQDPPATDVTLRSLEWTRAGDEVRLTGEVEVLFGQIHDAVVRMFDKEGAAVGQADIGDLDSNRLVSFELTSKRFPMIVATVAAESPCDDYRFPLVYLVDSDKSSLSLPEGFTTAGTTLRCEEELPPERVLETVATTTPDLDDLKTPGGG